MSVHLNRKISMPFKNLFHRDKRAIKSADRFRSRIRLAKLLLLCASVGLFSFYMLLGQTTWAFPFGPPPSFTNAPGESNCTACHASFDLDSGPGSMTIDGLPERYAPNQVVSVTVTINHPEPEPEIERLYWGFQLTAIDAEGRPAGTLVVDDALRTQLSEGPVEGNVRKYIQHTFPGTVPDPETIGQKRWTFTWVAPDADVGPITFYATGNAANNDGTPEGDYIYSASKSVPFENQTPSYTLSVYPEWQLIRSGENTGYHVTIVPTEGFTGDVTFSVSGVPEGVTAYFEPAVVTSPGSTMLWILTSEDTQPGDYPLTITGASGQMQSSVAATLKVSNELADISINKTASNTAVMPGSDLIYTIAITNNGPNYAFAINVADVLPTTLDFVSCTATGEGVCTGAGLNQTADFPIIAPGATETVTIATRVNDTAQIGTTIDNTAGVSALTADPELSNNSSTVVTSVGFNITLEPIITSGLMNPTYIANAHDGTNRLFILERAGRIKVLQPGASEPTLFLDIAGRVRSTGNEQGLLGLAFHPQYAENGRFFIQYTRLPDTNTNVIAEYKVSPNEPNVADPNSETILMTIPQPFANHNGGMVEFGPDGYLYIAKGDGGSANDPGNRAQNIEELLGKILRINVDQPSETLPYSSPEDNPFYGEIAGRDEIFAYGLRNPWRFSFDRETGELIIADVGQGQREEIDFGVLGGNYGWRIYEGTRCTGLGPDPCIPENYIAPIAEYNHSGGRCSVTGGYVYRGSQSSLPQGAYVYADYCSGEIFILQNGTQNLLLDTQLLITSFGEDEAGEIYVVGQNGTIYRFKRSEGLAGSDAN